MPDGELRVADLPFGENEDVQAFDEIEHWSERFLYDRYDWQHPAWLGRDMSDPAYNWLPIKLTKGYFTMVLPEEREWLCVHPDGRPKRLFANVQVYQDAPDRVRMVYAIRNGRKELGEPERIYLHREIAHAIWAPFLDRVDHKNGWSLDNRGSLTTPVNLRYISATDGACSVNSYNQPTGNKRSVNLDLPIGVRPDGRGKFFGRISFKTGRGKRAERLSCVFMTAEEARTWYEQQLDEITGYQQWMHNPETVNKPAFPPLREPELPFARHEAELEDIPF